MKNRLHLLVLSTVIFLMQNTLVYAQKDWTPRNAATNIQWKGVTYGNGLFVAVSLSGVSSGVMTSPDGINWTGRNTPTNDWLAVAYGNGKFVAVGDDAAMTSPDGINWTLQTAITGNQWIGVTYGNGLFVAVSYSATGQVMTSPDGITWTGRTAASANQWTSVTYGNNLFVAVSSVGSSNRAMTSPDGITWTSRNILAKQWHGVTYGNSLFVTVGPNTDTVMTSLDGITWTPRKSASDGDWHAVTYGGGMFVAVGDNGTGNRVMSSPNGINWKSQVNIPDLDWWCVTYGNGLFVAIDRFTAGTAGRVITSPVCPAVVSRDTQSHCDAFTWINGNTYDESTDTATAYLTTVDGCDSIVLLSLKILRSSGNGQFTCDASNWQSHNAAAENAWYGVTYGDDKFVAIAGTGLGNGIMISYNGMNWISKTYATSNAWSQITYGNGKFVGVSITGNSVLTSPDGSNWALYPAAADLQWRSVVYGNGRFVAVASTGTGNRVMTSPDGASWTSRTAVDNDWYGVTFGNGKFVAVASSGTGNRVMTSSDGITWTTRTSAADNAWRSVTYGNGLFVAVATSGTGNRVMTSPDGITWTAQTSAADNPWRSVTYGNGLFVAVASNGVGNRVMTSPDGITWTGQTSAADNQWYSVAYGKGKFVAVAITGTGNRVMTSECQEIPVPYPVSACGSYTWINGQTYTANDSTATYNLSNVNGCDSSLAILHLAIKPVPSPVISKNGDTLQTQVYTAYQWLLNNNIISGATGQRFTPTQNGSYSVIATNSSNCSDTSNVIVVTSIVGMQDVGNLTVNIYPNPAKGFCTISVPESSQAYTVSITDVLGRKATPTFYITGQQTLDVSNWVNGVYVVNISNDKHSKSLRFTTQK